MYKALAYSVLRKHKITNSHTTVVDYTLYSVGMKGHTLFSWRLWGTPKSKNKCIFLLALGTIFLLLDCLVQPLSNPGCLGVQSVPLTTEPTLSSLVQTL